MNVTLIHNHYQQPGGEDKVFAAEATLLESHGHTVTRYTVHNDAIDDIGRFTLAKSTMWNSDQYRKMRTLFREARPDVVHVHNTLPLISPAVYYAAKAEGAAVVQTLHNYRMICPSGLLFRDDQPCERCVGKRVAWPGVVHACYRGDHAASSVVAAMLSAHWACGTYRRKVDRYIALTKFAKAKFVEGSVPSERVVVKPNFLPSDPGVGSGEGGYALFVGRLSQEKGLRVLLDAWRHVGARLPLRIVGDGPLADEVRTAAASMEGVSMLGQLPPAQVIDEMKSAMVLVVPSLWYEGFPMSIAEAFAVGTPAIVSKLGSLAEIVAHRRTGLHFSPREPFALANAIFSAIEDPENLHRMRFNARKDYEQMYSADRNYHALVDIYLQATDEHRANGG